MMNPRRKAYRLEHFLDKYFGKRAVRVPLSGSVRGFKGDILLDGERCECKFKKVGFSRLYKWIESVKYLFIKQNRKPILVVIRLEDFKALLDEKTNEKA